MFPILVDFGGLTVYSYGVFVSLGFAAAYWFGHRETVRAGVDPLYFRDLALLTIVTSLLGARLLYIAVEWSTFMESPARIFEIWNGGMVFYGGLICAVIAGVIYVRATRIDPWPLLDVFAPTIALGHAIGRLGCFLAGCCYGAPCELPWAVTYVDPRGLARLGIAIHPSQLYDVTANLVLFVGLFVLLRSSSRAKGAMGAGQLFGWYLILYPIARFLIEFTRGDPRGFLGPLSTSQLLSILLAGVGGWIVYTRRNANTA